MSQVIYQNRICVEQQFIKRSYTIKYVFSREHFLFYKEFISKSQKYPFLKRQILIFSTLYNDGLGTKTIKSEKIRFLEIAGFDKLLFST